MMKTFGKVLFGTLTVFLLTGCFENDKEYYLQHPDEAESKFKECDADLAKAAILGDKEAFEEKQNNAECKAAREARKEIRRVKYEIEQKKREIEREKRAEEEKQKKIAWEKEYQEQLKSLASVPFADFNKLGDECGFSSSSPKCKAYHQLRSNRYEKEVESIIAQYKDIEELNAYKDKVCKGLQDFSCRIARDAVNQAESIAREKAWRAEKEEINSLVNNKEQLKEVYNSCYHEMMDLRKKQKWQEASNVTNSRKCMIAGKAAQKYGIYTWTSPIE
jgi:hypothetical protein